MRTGKKSVSEKLERRALLSAVFTASSGLLTVTGSTTGDQITFTKSGALLGLVEAGTTSSYAAASVKSIKVTLSAGADKVSVASTIMIPATITAGSGSDTLIGGGGITTFAFGTTAATGSSAQYVVSPGAIGAVLDFSGMPAADPVTADLSNDASLASFADKIVSTLAVGNGALFTTVIGGASDSNFTANSRADSLVGGTGNSTLVAGSGPDTLVGNGSQTDYIFQEQSASTTYTLSQAKAGQNQLDFSALVAGDSLTVNLNYDVMAAYDNVVVRDAKAGQYANFNWIDDGQGDDTVTGNKTNGNTIIGGNGSDYIYGGAGADFIDLGSGYNVVSGNGGADTIIGGSGFDTIFATNNTTDPLWYPSALTATAKTAVPGIQVYAGSGPESIVGGLGNDTLIGGSGDCTIHGMAGDDYIVGGGGNSFLFGDLGNDTIYGGGGNNTISGGAGENTIYGGTVGGTETFIDKNLPDDKTTAAQGVVLDTDALTDAAISAAQGLTLPTYPQVGSTGPGDIVIGGSADTTVIGGAGDETLSGGDGASTLVAGSGFDLLTAGYGSDVLQGGAGEDTMTAGGGPDSMTGGTGNSVFLNNNGYADTVIGGNGFNDAQQDPTGTTFFSNIQILYSPTGSIIDPTFVTPEVARSAVIHSAITPAITPAITTQPLATVSGGVLRVGSASFAGAENYTISESGGVVTVSGVSSVQSFAASTLHLVSVLGGAGSDVFFMFSLGIAATVNAGNGNNTIFGGTAPDTLTAGSGDDNIFGGTSTNVISGGGGNNILVGGTGNDTITGGSGSDWIFPYTLNAVQFGDSKADSIIGGSGTEKVSLSGNGDAMTVRLDKGTITDNTTGAVTRIKNVRNIWGGQGNDLMVGGTAGGILICAGSGNDTLFGISASDVLEGGTGDDQVFLDGNNGFIQLVGSHATTPGNVDYYNEGKTILHPLVDSTDIRVALVQHPA